MSFQNSITNGEQHWIARHLGITDPSADPVGYGIGLVVVAARRLGHPITWDDAESLTNDETGAVLDAAELTAAGDREQRSAAVADLLASLPATDTPAGGDASPEPRRPAETGPTSAPSSPSTAPSPLGTPSS